MDNMESGSYFDQIDDLLEFPSDYYCGGGNELRDSSGGCKDFPTIWDDEPLTDVYPPFPGSNKIAASELSAQLSVPYEDIMQLEWLSTFMDDSFSGDGITLPKNHTSSPVSVLESSNSSSSSSTTVDKYTPHRAPTHRARSKRPRPTTFNPRLMLQFTCPTNALSSTSDKFLDPNTLDQKPKKLKLKLPLSPVVVVNEKTDTHGVRKCIHCEITKTPQWRAGPMGPKTLCNACGVRYKSGRLFPEYRPASSPTFVPSLHSNSHKKVVQMRSKVVLEKENENDLVVENKPPVV